MTGQLRGPDPDGPPWSVDLLADLHAGLLDPGHSALLWPRVNADPEAKAIIDALDSVKVGLGELSGAPVPPMPARFAARLDAALEAEVRQAFAGSGAPVALQDPPRPEPAPVLDFAAAASRKRGRRNAWGVGLLTAAAAAVAIGFVVLPGKGPTTDGVAVPAPGGSADTGPLAVREHEVAGVVGQVNNRFDYGDLKDKATAERCVAANGVDAKAQLAGVRPITLDGKSGTMLLLIVPGEKNPFRVLVVKPDCEALFNRPVG
ncbi:hypothetical protein V5P93_007433 [Actinokineospora auranticolor]|uniref:Uncharacterized protein n=1 Tax=Actinokineospora auranticolor TaxID=155976 RepID=A0A2S6GS56_9PSEU|nr:hypothetical protein [Actinokineospora auranticolor]PPK68085.1 hypothetical protein CLV40_106318 [Actinokineospora auranticolor]